MHPEDLLTQTFVTLHPVEAARSLESMDPSTASTVLAPLEAQDISLVLGCCMPGLAARVIEYLNPAVAAKVVSQMPTSQSFVIFRQLDPSLQKALLEQFDRTLGISFRRALIHPLRTAGSMADPGVLTLPPDIQIEEAIERVRRNFRKTTYYLYVVDRDAKLEGVLTIKQLLVADPKDFTASVMNDQVEVLPADLNSEELLNHPHWQVFPTLPVVDREGIFLGALRYRALRKLPGESLLRKAPGSLPQALLELWEAYAFAGIRIMTEVAQNFSTPPKTDTNTERETKHQYP